MKALEIAVQKCMCVCVRANTRRRRERNVEVKYTDMPEVSTYSDTKAIKQNYLLYREMWVRYTIFYKESKYWYIQTDASMYKVNIKIA